MNNNNGYISLALNSFAGTSAIYNFTSHILLWGEFGTGKELIAHAIYERSAQKYNPLIVVDCDIPSGKDLEISLFGQEFATARNGFRYRKGVFEYTNDGICVFRNFFHANLNLQIGILRVLLESEVKRLDSKSPIKVDNKGIILSTHDPQYYLQQSSLLQYYFNQLEIISLKVPALRERKTEIPGICEQILKTTNAQNGTAPQNFSNDLLMRFQDYTWPGNYRELKSLVDSLARSTKHKVIGIDDLPEGYKFLKEKINFDNFYRTDYFTAKQKTVESFQKKYFTNLLEKHNGNISQVARDAKLSRQAIYKIIKSSV